MKNSVNAVFAASATWSSATHILAIKLLSLTSGASKTSVGSAIPSYSPTTTLADLATNTMSGTFSGALTSSF